MEFVISNNFSNTVSNPRAPVFSVAAACASQTQRFVLEADLDSVGAKGTLVLPEQTALRKTS